MIRAILMDTMKTKFRFHSYIGISIARAFLGRPHTCIVRIRTIHVSELPSETRAIIRTMHEYTVISMKMSFLNCPS